MRSQCILEGVVFESRQKSKFYVNDANIYLITHELCFYGELLPWRVRFRITNNQSNKTY